MNKKIRLCVNDFQQNKTEIGTVMEKMQLRNVVGGGVYNDVPPYANYADTISYSNTALDRPDPIPYPGPPTDYWKE